MSSLFDFLDYFGAVLLARLILRVLLSLRQQTAQDKQPVSPQNLSRSDIRQVQQALDKDGFNAGPKDGRWGRETESAVKQFQQSKQLQATGQLDQQTLADLGLDASRFTQSQSNQK